MDSSGTLLEARLTWTLGAADEAAADDELAAATITLQPPHEQRRRVRGSAQWGERRTFASMPLRFALLMPFFGQIR